MRESSPSGQPLDSGQLPSGCLQRHSWIWPFRGIERLYEAMDDTRHPRLGIESGRAQSLQCFRIRLSGLERWFANLR